MGNTARDKQSRYLENTKDNSLTQVTDELLSRGILLDLLLRSVRNVEVNGSLDNWNLILWQILVEVNKTNNCIRALDFKWADFSLFMESYGGVSWRTKVPRTAGWSPETTSSKQESSPLWHGKSCRRSAWTKKEHTEGGNREGLLGRNRDTTWTRWIELKTWRGCEVSTPRDTQNLDGYDSEEPHPNWLCAVWSWTTWPTMAPWNLNLPITIITETHSPKKYLCNTCTVCVLLHN